MGLLDTIRKREGSDGSGDRIRNWCRVNMIRGFTVGISAWGCLLAAFLA